MNIFELIEPYWPLISQILTAVAIIVGAACIFIITWWIKHENEENDISDILLYLIAILVAGIVLISQGYTFYFYIFVVGMILTLVAK